MNVVQLKNLCWHFNFMLVVWCRVMRQSGCRARGGSKRVVGSKGVRGLPAQKQSF